MIEILAGKDETVFFLGIACIVIFFLQLWLLIWFIQKMNKFGRSLEAIEIIGKDILAFQKWQCEVKQEENRN
jgi:ribose/xylose/arabinose/galactoside ABC-type transport system permease subunit